MPTAKKTVWVSAKGQKHRVDVATGHTPCGLKFNEPYPACDRTHPVCKACTKG